MIKLLLNKYVLRWVGLIILAGLSIYFGRKLYFATWDKIAFSNKAVILLQNEYEMTVADNTFIQIANDSLNSQLNNERALNKTLIEDLQKTIDELNKRKNSLEKANKDLTNNLDHLLEIAPCKAEIRSGFLKKKQWVFIDCETNEIVNN
jgi:cell division protein FtsB